LITSIAFPKRKSAYSYYDKSSTRRIAKLEKRPFSFVAEVPHVFGKTFKFKPGLNIIIGRNGVGKSTVLKACGLSLAAVQGGRTTVTETWMREIFSFSGDEVLFPWSIAHDGQPALFVDPRIAIGMAGGGAAFDTDFFSQGIMATTSRGSTGEITINRINFAISVILGKVRMPESIEWRISKTEVNDIWARRMVSVEKILAPTIDTGAQTIIMDEPESYLSLPFQVGFWKNIIGEDSKRFENLQVIIATHSPFALGIAHANYVEMEKGYLVECENALKIAGMIP